MTHICIFCGQPNPITRIDPMLAQRVKFYLTQVTIAFFDLVLVFPKVKNGYNQGQNGHFAQAHVICQYFTQTFDPEGQF